MQKVTNASNEKQAGRPTTLEQIGNLPRGIYSSLLYALWLERAALYDSDTREMAVRMLSAFMEMESIERNTFDPTKALITSWGNALKPGEMTVSAYGLLNTLLNEVRPGSEVRRAGEHGRLMIKLAVDPTE